MKNSIELKQLKGVVMSKILLTLGFFSLSISTGHPLEALTPHSEYLIAMAGSINVKNYPAPIQDTNALFEAKCTTCHGLKETVRSPSVLPTYWEKSVEKMRAMPKADFSAEEGQKITEFLIYDSFQRRRVELKKQLKALPEAELKIEQEKLDNVLKKYPT